MEYRHDPDLTCLVHGIARKANHIELLRYSYPFHGEPSNTKASVRLAADKALRMRSQRGIDGGHLLVELDVDSPGCGRVVDVVSGRTNVVDIPDAPAPEDLTVAESA